MYVAFTEIPDEVVVGRFWSDLSDVTEAPAHAPLHLEARELSNDSCDLRCSDKLVLQAYHIQADAGSTERHLRLLVEADGRGGIEGDAVPDQLGAALVETALPCEDPSEIGAFDFEPARTVEPFVERDVVQERTEGDDLSIMIELAELADPYRKQPGTDNVVEQIGLAFAAGIIESPIHKWRIGNRYPREYPAAGFVHVGVSLAGRSRIIARGSPVR